MKKSNNGVLKCFFVFRYNMHDATLVQVLLLVPRFLLL